MKVTLLGTGTSTGVPSIGCGCETCTSDDPRDKRLRVSILVEHDGQSVLVDTSSDFRQQALRVGLKRLDAVLITHCHADHIFGLDDIRPLNFRHGALGVYANERAWVDIRRIFKYVFEPTHFGGGLPQVLAHTVVDGAPFCLSPNLDVTPIEVIHGRLPVVAYRFNDFAYATDLSEIPGASLERLRDLDTLVLDCLRVRPHPTHLTLESALAYVGQLRPRRTYLTHITHDIKHARDSRLLPPGVEWAYDGLEIEI
ncbi:MAG TPA: MBL fold metallo-hydrolase [Pyrinomonadaceae bacterium]|jgi:phosphoribosyl 1,2-cyclic phosphate phosphodiesterase|nr:MBL fold metallo-hydrolase [Pyrinomonadaceae bacterium]